MSTLTQVVTRTQPKSFASRIQRLGTEAAFHVAAQSREWATKGFEIYPFHLGDLNFSTPQNIIEAAIRSLYDGKTGYSPVEGILPLRKAIAEEIGFKRDVYYTPSNVSIQPGGKPIIGKFLQAVMQEGDEVLYPNPGYPIYESQIDYYGGIAVPYKYVQSDSGFILDLDLIEHMITDRTKIFIYNNHNNPFGSDSSEQEMEALAEIAIKYNLWVLSDEAYFDITYDTHPRSIVSIPGMLERTVILYTASKKYAMTGWRVGAAIGPERLIQIINKLNSNIEACTAHFSQWALLEALEGDQKGCKDILKELKIRRNKAVQCLNNIKGIQIKHPNSTFYLFVDVSEIMKRKGISNLEKLRTEALQKTGVSFCIREHFGRSEHNHNEFYLRLAYGGIDLNKIEEGLHKLKELFEDTYKH